MRQTKLQGEAPNSRLHQMHQVDFCEGKGRQQAWGNKTRSPLNGAIELIYKGSCQCPLLCKIDVFFLPKLWSTQLVFWGTKESTPKDVHPLFSNLN